jgi:Zn-dependent peptidase ImmA (M78 family)
MNKSDYDTAISYFKKIEHAIIDSRTKQDDIVDPVSLARSHGVRVARANFDKIPGLQDKLGYYRIDPDSDSGSLHHTICCREPINPLSWYNFVLAHELGHFFLYEFGIRNLGSISNSTIVNALPKPKGDGLNEDKLSVEEIACNRFARAMLMPDTVYRTGVTYYMKREFITKANAKEELIAEYLAKDFNVPYSHAFLRGKDLEVFPLA